MELYFYSHHLQLTGCIVTEFMRLVEFGAFALLQMVESRFCMERLTAI